MSIMKRKTLYIILAVLFAVILVEGYLYYKSMKYYKEPVPEAVSIADLQAREALGISEVVDDESEGEESPEGEGDDFVHEEGVKRGEYEDDGVPEQLNLSAPFFSQAPYGNWDYPWQEACEEASVLIVANVYFDRGWTKSEFNDEILDLVEWEKQRFGQYEHTSVEETVEILEDYLGLEAVVHEDPSFEDIQQVLADGHLIVMTFAGKRLGNPFYTNGGPNYHAMVIKGYKKDNKIITHDVGTRRGEDYVYSWSVIKDSMHDYAEPIESGAKMMIEVIPPATQ